MHIQKTVITLVSAAASLMLIAGTLAPVAYGAATVSAASSCTVRAAITAEEAGKLAPGDANAAIGFAAGSVLYEPGTTSPGGASISTPNWGLLCTYSVIKQISGLLFLVVGILSVAMIVFAAFLFLTAGASPGKEKEARTALLFAIIGILVATAAYFIPSIALSFMGIHS